MSGFNLQESNNFEREVSFSIPKGKGWRKVTLNCEFKLDTESDGKKSVRNNRDLLGDVLVSVRGIASPDGSDADPTTDAVRQVIAHDVAAAAVAKSYVEALNEGVERKN